MSDEFGQLLSEQKEVAISQGAVVSGQVIAVKEDEIVLNIGYKADAVISRNEFTNIPNANLCDLVKVGDEIEAKVVKMNDGEGQVQLSVRKLQAERGSKVLEDAFENKTVLKAVVTEISTGGLSVVVDQTRVFIPASLVSDVYEKNLEKYKGQEVEFIVTEFNPKKHRIIGNCKELIIEKKKKMQEELFAKLEVGQTVEGTVKNVTDFGAFVDLGLFVIFLQNGFLLLCLTNLKLLLQTLTLLGISYHICMNLFITQKARFLSGMGIISLYLFNAVIY